MASLSLALGACAGAGTSYPCISDGGTACHGNPFYDGGTITVGTFVSPAVTIWHDGQHNSDADVVSFQGALFAVFRHAPSYAVSYEASLVVVRSNDQGATWTKSAELNLLDGEMHRLDLREPKLAVFQNGLHVTATAWAPADPNDHHTSVVTAVSADGSAFSALADTGLLAGSEAWRPRAAGDSLWLTAWKADELYPSDVLSGLSLYASLDGRTFGGAVPLPAGLGGVGPGARQGELIIRADSTMWLTIPERSETDAVDRQTICHSAFQLPLSFSCWSVQQAPIASPVLFEFNGVLFVSGEHDLPNGDARTALWQVDEANQAFNLIADLPQSEGETGAPGVVGLDATHALITYHSTSKLDPRVQALAQEPTTLQSVSQAYAVDAMAVVLDLSQVPAGL